MEKISESIMNNENEIQFLYKPQLHGKYLAYWTGGKDISDSIANQIPILKLTAEMRDKYVNRIFETFRSGLWLTTPSERVFGHWDDNMEYKYPFISFTEIRAANIATHASRYGLLGFVFDRDFVIKRYGGPVFYLNKKDWKVTNINNLRVHFEELLKSIPESGKKKISDIQNGLYMLIRQLKPMHGDNAQSNYDNYEECEWRLLYSDMAEKEGYIIRNKMGDPAYFLPFEMRDLRFLIVPDEETKRKFVDSNQYKRKLHSQINTLTIEEYAQI